LSKSTRSFKLFKVEHPVLKTQATLSLATADSPSQRPLPCSDAKKFRSWQGVRVRDYKLKRLGRGRNIGTTIWITQMGRKTCNYKFARGTYNGKKLSDFHVAGSPPKRVSTFKLRSAVIWPNVHVLQLAWPFASSNVQFTNFANNNGRAMMNQVLKGKIIISCWFEVRGTEL
jgi:hypothetical protein